MSVHRAGHSANCERSQTPPARCRCKDCLGSLHGVQAASEQLRGDTTDQDSQTERQP
jgi:hypothetical protein